MRKNNLEAILIIPDTHRPYHDKRAWALMLKVAKELKPKHIIVQGDFADFFSVSSHSKNPTRALQLDKEILDVNVGLDELDQLGAKNKLFVAGNHENRLERYLQDKAPELFGLVSIPQLLKLDKRGWQYTAYRQDAKLGKLKATHDVGTSGRGATYKALETYHRNIVVGHSHRIEYVVEGSADGERHLAASFGWLGDVKEIDYLQKVKAQKSYSLGFGIGYLDPKSGNVYLVPVPIVGYTVVVNGRLYRG